MTNVDLDRIADDPAERIGAALAAALHLRPDPHHFDRWLTSDAWGTKTNKGLARIVGRIIADELHAEQSIATQSESEDTMPAIFNPEVQS